MKKVVKILALILIFWLCLVSTTSCDFSGSSNNQNTKEDTDNPKVQPVEEPRYQIRWVDKDGQLLKTDTYKYGEMPYYDGEKPYHEENGYGYNFKEWSPAVTIVTKDETYQAIFDIEKKTYTVSFEDYKGDILYVFAYEYGDEIKYPEKLDDYSIGDDYFEFVGWDNYQMICYGNSIVKPLYQKSDTPFYNVTFVDSDGTIISTKKYKEGSLIDIPTKPTREPDDNYFYTFLEWKGEFTGEELSKTATKDITYVATYKYRTRNYEVAWKDDNGEVIIYSSVKYNEYPSFPGNVPTKEDDQYIYKFVRWDREFSPVTEDTEYTAIFEKEAKKYNVKWVDYDDTLLKEEKVEYGKTPIYDGKTPTRENNAYYIVFDGWDKEIAPVTKDVTYKATYKISPIPYYTISFVNYDGTVLQSDIVKEGDLPIYKNNNPVRDYDDDYIYTFATWDKEIGIATENTTYTATYSTKPNKFTITWKNYDGSILLVDENGKYGKIPEYTGILPVKEGDAQISYVFNGWNTTPSEITEDTIYIATFDETATKYSIKWLNEDGSVIKTDEVPYGDTPAYEGDTPTKNETAKYTYNFIGWKEEIVKVVSDAQYTANFESIIKTFTVKWLNEDGSILDIEYDVEYDTIPVYKGETPVKEKTTENSYTFKGWDKDLNAITGDISFIATFDSAINKYKVTWTNLNGSIIKVDDELDYGTTPKYVGDTPTMKTGFYKYTFTGWDKEATPITEDQTYVATYSTELNVILFGTSSYQIRGVIDTTIEEIEIPKKYNGSYIYRISSDAFAGCTSLKKVIVNDDISEISPGAFYGCSALESITIPFVGNKKCSETNDYQLVFGYIFGTKSFDNTTATNMQFVDKYPTTKYETYYIPNSLKEVIITEKCSYIQQGAFYNCKNIKTFVLPKTIKAIGSNAFYGTTITDTYYNGTLDDWLKVDLKNYKANPGKNLYFLDENGTIEYNNLKYGYLTEIIVPEGTKEVKYYYSGLSSITKIIIPEGVTTISNVAFYSLGEVDYLELPSTITSIGYNAFYYTTFKNVYYNGDLESWCNIKFENENASPAVVTEEIVFLKDDGKVTHNNLRYDYLEEAVIPDSISSIGDYQFRSFTTITKITLNNSIKSIGKEAFRLSSITGINLENVSSIGEYAFTTCRSLNNIVLSDELETIEQYTFSACSSIDNIKLSKSLKVIGKYGFHSVKFSTLVLPDGLKSIGYCAFSFCTMTTAIIPNSVETMENSIFSSCSNLTTVITPFIGANRYEPTDTEFKTFGYLGTSTIVNIEITDSPYLQKNLFANSKIENVSFSKEVKSIGEKAFENCSNLTNVYYNGTVSDWCNIEFEKQTSTPLYGNVNFYIYDENGVAKFNNKNYANYNDLIIPDDVTKINDFRFYKALKITSLTTSLTNFTNLAFYDCKNMKTVYYNGTIKNWCESTIKNTYNSPMQYASEFYLLDPNGDVVHNNNNYVNVNNLTLTSDVDLISNYAFYNFKCMEELTIPSSLATVNLSAFYECNNLRKIYYDGTLSDWCNIDFGNEKSNPMTYSNEFYILNENGEFTHNSKKYSLLTNMIIDDTITEIKQYQFNNFNCVITTIIPASVTKIAEGAFKGCYNLESIQIPFVGGAPYTTSGEYNYPFGYIFGKEKFDKSTITTMEYTANVIGTMYNKTADYYIPDSITEVKIIGNSRIQYGSFTNCSSIRTIYLGETIESVSFYAMASLPNLESIVIDSNNKYLRTDVQNAVVKNNALYAGCKNTIIPSNLRSIEDYAFYNHSGLAALELPISLRVIGNSALIGTSIDTIYYNGYSGDLANIEYHGNPSSKTMCPLRSYSNHLYVKDDNGDIIHNGYKYGIVKDVKIPSTITEIQHGSYYGIETLESVEIPESITDINSYAFAFCTSLKSIDIPGTINRIYDKAFTGCTSLENVHISVGVKVINYPFSGCTSLKTINYDGTVASWKEICSGIPSSVTVICRDGQV